MIGFKVWFAFRAKNLDTCNILTLRFHHTINAIVFKVIRIRSHSGTSFVDISQTFDSDSAALSMNFEVELHLYMDHDMDNFQQ